MAPRTSIAFALTARGSRGCTNARGVRRSGRPSRRTGNRWPLSRAAAVSRISGFSTSGRARSATSPAIPPATSVVVVARRSWLAFSSDRDSKRPTFNFVTLHSTEIYLARADGSGLRRATACGRVRRSCVARRMASASSYYEASLDDVQKITSPRRSRATSANRQPRPGGERAARADGRRGREWSPHWNGEGRIDLRRGGRRGRVVSGPAGARGEIAPGVAPMLSLPRRLTGACGRHLPSALMRRGVRLRRRGSQGGKSPRGIAGRAFRLRAATACYASRRPTTPLARAIAPS